MISAEIGAWLSSIPSL